MQVILTPPVALGIYAVLVGLLLTAAWKMAARGAPSPSKTAWYSSGEKAQAGMAATGYRPFFMVALFFAILHLGVLILGSGGLTPIMGAYLAGLILVLVILILG